MWLLNAGLLWAIFVFNHAQIEAFNPFSDDDLYAINWAGHTELEKLKVGLQTSPSSRCSTV